jgi:hypothetical protein
MAAAINTSRPRTFIDTSSADYVITTFTTVRARGSITKPLQTREGLSDS